MLIKDLPRWWVSFRARLAEGFINIMPLTGGGADNLITSWIFLNIKKFSDEQKVTMQPVP